jgi:hypothetical protein
LIHVRVPLIQVNQTNGDCCKPSQESIKIVMSSMHGLVEKTFASGRAAQARDSIQATDLSLELVIVCELLV